MNHPGCFAPFFFVYASFLDLISLPSLIYSQFSPGASSSPSGSPGIVTIKNRRTKMNHCGIQQNGNFSSFGNGEPVVCPKPRRLSLFNSSVHEPVRPFRWQMCYQSELQESNAGPELLDLILAKEQTTCTQIPSSPPFFSGSPPSRVSNPLIQDARFRDNKISSPISPRSTIPNPNFDFPSPSPSSSSRTGGCNKPSVRVEGFDCLDRGNRRSCSIPALA
ncbi:hypothetical protein SSX86_017607 [Deinandra increscens subsp. villosa]|uniref:Uncharacterized protein n=1 Tax=Deinandra increscens subsp. villosa TaxID=3103831 RepID=A0AAP0GYR1_9ASTR